MEKFRFATIEEIKPHLRPGDYLLIAEMLDGKYSKRTIEAQLGGTRTLKDPIIEAANKLIEYRENLVKSFQS